MIRQEGDMYISDVMTTVPEDARGALETKVYEELTRLNFLKSDFLHMAVSPSTMSFIAGRTTPNFSTVRLTSGCCATALQP